VTLMGLRQVAIDPRGVAHAVKFDPSAHPGELCTACGIQARWRRLTLWWSPLVMDDESRLNRPVDCMACLVVEARR
jgi:hypothetical protein